MASEKIVTGETVTKTSALKALVASRRFSQSASRLVGYGNYTLAKEYAQAAVTEAVVAAEIIRRLK